MRKNFCIETIRHQTAQQPASTCPPASAARSTVLPVPGAPTRAPRFPSRTPSGTVTSLRAELSPITNRPPRTRCRCASRRRQVDQRAEKKPRRSRTACAREPPSWSCWRSHADAIAPAKLNPATLAHPVPGSTTHATTQIGSARAHPCPPESAPLERDRHGQRQRQRQRKLGSLHAQELDAAAICPPRRFAVHRTTSDSDATNTLSSEQVRATARSTAARVCAPPQR